MEQVPKFNISIIKAKKQTLVYSSLVHDLKNVGTKVLGSG